MTVGFGALGVAVAWMLGFTAGPLFAHLNGPQRFGFAYGLGLVWISTMMGVAALVGLPLTPLVGVLFIVAPAAGLWLWRRGRARRPLTETTSRWLILPVSRDLWWWGTAVLLALLWVIVATRAVVKPIQFWDAWATYAFKAKVIYLEGSIPRGMFEWVVAPNYPLGVPLQEVWVAWFVGSWDDVAIKWLFPGYLLAMLALVYGALCERWSARAAMGGTLVVAGLPFVLQHGHDGYTDLPLAYFALGAAVTLTRYALFGDRRDLVLAAVFAAGLVWTRADGAVLVACNALLLTVMEVRKTGSTANATWTAVSLYLGPPALVWGAWALVQLNFGISSNLRADALSAVPFLDRWPIMVDASVRALFLDGNWLILWALVFLAVVFRFRDVVTAESAFLIWPVVTYLGVVGALFATTDLVRFLGDDTVLHRLILHVAPLAALWVLLVLGRWWGVDRTPLRARSVAR